MIWTGSTAKTMEQLRAKTMLGLTAHEYTRENNFFLFTTFLSFCRFVIAQVGRESAIRSTQPHLHVTVRDYASKELWNKMEINVATNAFAHETEREHNVDLVLPWEGAQYVAQYLFEAFRQMTWKGGTGSVYTLPEITHVCKLYNVI